MVARIFVAKVGRVPLLMLDTDVETNSDLYRDVTDRLYGGNSEHRLRQELLLGVGGVRAIRAFCRTEPPTTSEPLSVLAPSAASTVTSASTAPSSGAGEVAAAVVEANSFERHGDHTNTSTAAVASPVA